jgi:hypothetical protein
MVRHALADTSESLENYQAAKRSRRLRWAMASGRLVTDVVVT